MNPDRVGRWRQNGVQLRAVYRVRETDLGNVGECWMKGRLFVGDLISPIQHSGDSFYTYVLIEGGDTRPGRARRINARGQFSYRLCKGAEFGGYSMGVLHDEQPTEHEWDLLMAGESTAFSLRIDVAQATAQAAAASDGEAEQAIREAVASVRAEFEASKGVTDAPRFTPGHRFHLGGESWTVVKASHRRARRAGYIAGRSLYYLVRHDVTGGEKIMSEQRLQRTQEKPLP